MEEISWGIIGCGDVTEVKSGPAFNKVPNSRLTAVMRRDASKAKDYADRHHVPKWYSDASQLINDPEINAIYVATPPSSHEEYCIATLKAGKPVYVEKPMSLNAAAAQTMTDAASESGQKLVVAHYRRKQPIFLRIRELIEGGEIGTIHSVKLNFLKPFRKPKGFSDQQLPWRLNTAISGGGFFHDLAPHQLDILLHFFGAPIQIKGTSTNRAGNYEADDLITARMEFQEAIVVDALWDFGAREEQKKDECVVSGSKGSLTFSFFNNQPVEIMTNDGSRSLNFDPLPHVQQPMIQSVVNYFLDREPNPCTGQDGVAVMKMMDEITRK